MNRIAVVGAGVSGLACAWLLSPRHDVTLFEANRYLGGHTNTVDVTLGGLTHPVDTGFLVFNDRTYPNLLGLFAKLGIESAESDMSFSVRIGAGELEWAGNNLASVFAQPANLVKPAFLRMLRDLVRFNREATRLATAGETVRGSLGDFLDDGGYGPELRHWYLVPMAACIWSTPSSQVRHFPMQTFLSFCHNHGLLAISNRPQWRTVVGGGRQYVQRIARDLKDIRLGVPVRRVTRTAQGVEIATDQGTEAFDAVVMATHTDQSLALLAEPSTEERAVLKAIPYQANTAVLHTDAGLLPTRPRAWAAWNFFSPSRDAGDHPVSLSYLINRLQPVPFRQPVLVTMNPRPEAAFAPRPESVIASFDYHHPVFLEGSDEAKRRVADLQGKRRTWFCGAWTRHGFHEDGLASAVNVARLMNVSIPWTARAAT